MFLKLLELYFAWAGELKPKTQSRINDFFQTLTTADVSVIVEDEFD